MSWGGSNLIYRLILGFLLFIISMNFIVFLTPFPQRFSRITSIQDPYKIWESDVSKNLGPIKYAVIKNISETYEGIPITREKISFPMYVDDQKVTIVGELVYPSNYREYKRETHGILLIHGIYSNRRMMMPIAKKLAKDGFVALAIDAAGHGESGFAFKSKEKFLPPVDEKNIKASLLYQVYLSGIAGVSVLETVGKERFDLKDIGVMGISMGGLAAYMIAALDNRIAYAVPMIASGGLVYTISSGGVANALISPDTDIDKLKQVGIALDPYYFADRIKVPIFIIYSTNDEFFPMEGLIDTFNKLGTNARYVKIKPNVGHKITENDIAVALEFISKTLRNTRMISSLKINKFYLGLMLIDEVKYPPELHPSVYWKAAIPGFPWLKISGELAFIPTLFPVDYYAEVRSPNGNVVVSTLPENIDPNSSLIYILAAFVISLIIFKKVYREIDSKWLVGKYLAYILLLISLVTPVAIYPDRFMVNMFQVLDRFGTKYQLIIHESTYTLIAIIILSFSYSLENLQRLSYTALSTGFAMFMILNYYIIVVAMSIAGFKPWIIPLTSLIPLILGNITLHIFYKQYLKRE